MTRFRLYRIYNPIDPESNWAIYDARKGRNAAIGMDQLEAESELQMVRFKSGEE